MSFADPKIAEIYKSAEKLTGQYAKLLLEQAGINSTREDALTILDDACGTGVVSSQLYELLGNSAKEKLELVCGDISAPMIQYTSDRIEKSGWKGARAQVFDAQVLLYPKFVEHPE
jgi:ubiquinone/menaquinone biosynthesis C-methylase UbiE